MKSSSWFKAELNLKNCDLERYFVGLFLLDLLIGDLDNYIDMFSCPKHVRVSVCFSLNTGPDIFNQINSNDMIDLEYSFAWTSVKHHMWTKRV